MITLEYMKFKNIRSYGNSCTTWTFEKGIHQISGPNGGGKSTLLDVLSYNWYGVPFSKIKIAELTNRTNKKNLFTETQFKSDTTTYRIVRGLKPNILQIFKNDEELDLLSSKSLIQDGINEILGIDYTLFKQIVALSINVNKPFLTLSAGEKREIVETIFNVDVFGIMMKQTKKFLSELKIDLKIKSAELKTLSDSYTSFLKQYEDYKFAKENFDKNKKSDIEQIKLSIDEYQKKIKKAESNIQAAKKAITKLSINPTDTIDTINRDLNELNNQLSVLLYKQKQNTAEKEFLDTHKDCSVCGQKIDSEHKKKHLDKIKESEDEILIKRPELQNAIKELVMKLSSIKSDSETNIRICQAIENEEHRIKTFKCEIKNSEKHIDEISNRTLQFNIDALKTELDKKEKDFSDLTTMVRELNNEYEDQIIMQSILSETGVKSHFMKKLLPLLNNKIAYYLDKFSMPFVFQFDETLEERILELSGRSIAVSYESCSMGEKKRFDLSIVFAFIDIMKCISGWDCNILFIDELLDSAVDSDNLKLIMECISDVFSDGAQQCTYVISHREHDSDIFDKLYNISKKGLFSSIVQKE
jgi:DNA repair exonuclease SbcCD ATPase subunit